MESHETFSESGSQRSPSAANCGDQVDPGGHPAHPRPILSGALSAVREETTQRRGATCEGRPACPPKRRESLRAPLVMTDPGTAKVTRSIVVDADETGCGRFCLKRTYRGRGALRARPSSRGGGGGFRGGGRPHGRDRGRRPPHQRWSVHGRRLAGAGGRWQRPTVMARP